MSNIWTIMSKEFTRFFTDSRMVIMTIMPAVLIYVIYSFMGTLMSDIFAPDEGRSSQVFAVNMPADIASGAVAWDIDVTPVEAAETDGIKEKLVGKDEETDALIIFPQDFDAQISAFAERLPGAAAPNIEIYYNSTVPNSSQAYSILSALLYEYESSLANVFDINVGVGNADLATDEAQSAMFISMMMPMLLMIFLVSGCTGLALESITGEKERGTLATLLVSPLGRSELAIGKILSLAALSFLSGAATAVATILSLPNLAGGSDTINVAIYSTTDYALLAFVILSVLLVIVAMLSIVSAFSKTVKEAGQATSPIMILVMVVGVTGMLGNAPADAVYYLIPLYGSVQSMNGIFSMDYSVTNVLVSCIGNLAYAALGGFALAKMFNSERVMFSR